MMQRSPLVAFSVVRPRAAKRQKNCSQERRAGLRGWARRWCWRVVEYRGRRSYRGKDTRGDEVVNRQDICRSV